jgi:tetratricopeptide (TPR) repeat protein
MKFRPVSIVFLSLLFLFYAVEMYPKNKIFGKNETDFWLSFKDTSRENLLARFNVGVTYLPRDEKKAMEIFNSILSQKEHHLYSRYEEKIYEDLFQYFTFKKNFNMAEKYFNTLIKLRRDQSQHFYFIYAFFLAFKGEISEGEKIVVEMLNFFPQNHLVLLYSAKFYIIIKNNEKASELLTRDYNLFPTRETFKLLQKLMEEKNQGAFSSQ